MKNISTLDSLQKHLLQKQKEKREQIESLTRRELEQLGANLQDAVTHALHTIESDMQKRIGRMNQSLQKSLDQTGRQIGTLQTSLRKIWLKPALIGLSLFLGISSGSWGLMQFLAARIQNQVETLSQLRLQIGQEQQALQLLRNESWGVTLHQDKQGKFVVLPVGFQPKTFWSVEGRPALMLSNE